MIRPTFLVLFAMLFSTVSSTATARTSNSAPAQRLFNRVNEIILHNYGGLSQVDRSKLHLDFQKRLDLVCQKTPKTCRIEKAFPVITAEMSELGDQHSYFQTPNEFKEFMLTATGGNRQQFGIKLAELDGENRVVLEVVPNSAAEKVGLSRGDVFRTIDGEPYVFSRLQKARLNSAQIRLGVERRGQLFDIDIAPQPSSTRDLPRLSFIGQRHDVGLLRIPTFLSTGGIAEKVHELVATAQSVGVRGIIVDLRGNTGGSLIECDNAISAFVPEFVRIAHHPYGTHKTVVRGGARYEAGEMSGRVTKPSFWMGPLAVLVDQDSASCSEFFAFEVQHAKRGLVLGEETSGVGNTATRIFPIGRDMALQLTVTHYLKEDGQPYPMTIQPDRPLPQGEEEVRQLTRGEDILLNAGISVLSEDATLSSERLKVHP